MIDHKDLEDLPLEEMSLYPKEHTPPHRSPRLDKYTYRPHALREKERRQRKFGLARAKAEKERPSVA